MVLLFCLVIKTICTDANNADLCLGINMMGDYHEKINRTPFKIFTCRCMLLELYMSILATELFSPLIKIEFRTKSHYSYSAFCMVRNVIISTQK